MKSTDEFSSTHVEPPSFLDDESNFFKRAVGARIRIKKILRIILELISPNNFPKCIQYLENKIANPSPHSCIVDGTQTRVSHGKLIKTLVWCDNEWGFANRMLDTAFSLYQFTQK